MVPNDTPQGTESQSPPQPQSQPEQTERGPDAQSPEREPFGAEHRTMQPPDPSREASPQGSPAHREVAIHAEVPPQIVTPGEAAAVNEALRQYREKRTNEEGQNKRGRTRTEHAEGRDVPESGSESAGE